jgi:hypothetical protein
MRLAALSMLTASLLLLTGCGGSSDDSTTEITDTGTVSYNPTFNGTGASLSVPCTADSSDIDTLTLNGSGNTYDFIDCTIDKIVFSENNTALKLSGSTTINSFEYSGNDGNSVEASQTILDIIHDSPSLHEIPIY